MAESWEPQPADAATFYNDMPTDLGVGKDSMVSGHWDLERSLFMG